MATFFAKYPKLLFNNRLVTDIIARTSIRERYSDKLSIFYPYTLQEGDTPEIIAEKYYGDPEKHWIVLLANNIIDPFFEFPYIIFQLIGAFIGAMLVFLVYYSKWIEFDTNLEHTASVFATFPAVNNFVSGFFDQVVGTFLLLYLILAITDKNDNNPKQFTPVVIGFLVMAIGISFGGMHGYAINPARDFAPRLFALLVGFKNTGFSDFSIWIVPIIGPILGGILGAVAYDITIGRDVKNNKQ